MDKAKIQSFTDGLIADANARIAFVVDRDSRVLAASGELDRLDSTSVARAIAGAAEREAAARQLKEMGALFLETSSSVVCLQLVENRVLCVVYFDERSTLGVVRLHIRKASNELLPTLTGLAEFSGSDIDNLFRD